VDLTRSARGRTHDLTAAGTHRIIRICKRQGVPVLADRAYIGAGSWVTTPIRRLPHQDLNPTQRTINRALSAARAPVERSVARLKSWRIFRRSRCSPNRMSVIAAAVLSPERATLKTLSTPAAVRVLSCVFDSGSGGRWLGGVFSRPTTSVCG
jgi:hypothetical protein